MDVQSREYTKKNALYTLNEQIAWYINYTSIKLFSKSVCVFFDEGRTNCQSFKQLRNFYIPYSNTFVLM